MQSQQKAKIILLLATLIWGLAPIAVELLLNYLTPLQTITFRFGIAVLILSVFLPLWKGRETFSLLTSKTCVLLGWATAFGHLAATTGQKMTTAGLATLISTSFVFIVPFLAWKLEGTKLYMRTIVLAAIALTGIFLISFNGNWANFSSLSILGILILILAAFLYGIYIVISGKFLHPSNRKKRKVDLACFTYANLVHTFLPLLIISMIMNRSFFSLPLKIMPFVLFLAIFPTIFAFILYHKAIVKVGSVNSSFYLVIQVIVPLIYELAFAHQYYSIWVYSGILVLLITIGGIRDKGTPDSEHPPSKWENVHLIDKEFFMLEKMSSVRITGLEPANDNSTTSYACE
ncbi:MAG: DMT family transporter [Candidatus Hodarchaeota archaeon]